MKNLPFGKSVDSPIYFKAGSVIFIEGEVSAFLCLVKKGEIRLVKKNGSHLNLVDICKEREILNEVSILTNKPMTFSAIAKTDAELVLVDKKDINSVINNGPAWIKDIFGTLCDRLQTTQEIIEEHNLIGSDKDPAFILSKDEELKIINALAEYQAH